MISPPKLLEGDSICILSTARKISVEEIQPATQILNSWGLKVILASHLFSINDQFAGTDEQRLSDLQQAIDDPSIKAIICARGGYGTSRISDKLDLSNLHENPKWIVGFSDVTALHLHLQTSGLESIHGIMPVVFSKPNSEESIDSLKWALFGNAVSYQIPPNNFNRLGKATGQLVGGNLSLINHIIGTGSEPDWKGKILFLEDIDEYLYHIDRLMLQLRRAGILKSILGLVVGHFTDMKDNAVPFGQNAYEIIQSNVCEYNFPVAFEFPIGHEAQNWAVICGRETELVVSETRVEFIQKTAV
jgi:muramoyltetrapeptide carboxypeptidase